MAVDELVKRESFLEMVRGEGTGLVPASVFVNGSLWDSAPELFKRLQAECSHVVFRQERAAEREKENLLRDGWGCVWHYPGGYMDGQVVEHPLADWSAFSSYRPPQAEKYRDWPAEAEAARQAKVKGELVRGSIAHGFLYLELTYLRGFENFMTDLAGEKPELYELRDMVVSFWVEVVKRWVDLGADVISFGDDLGHQNALPISPAAWRKFLKPAFGRIFEPCREAGLEIYLHTDGWILDIIPDLLEVGVTILNPQDLVNGLDNLKKLVGGRACIDLDIDRQNITVFGTGQQIDEHILRCIKSLGSPGGRLMLKYGAYPGTPIENIAQVARSMEKYHDYWVDG